MNSLLALDIQSVSYRVTGRQLEEGADKLWVFSVFWSPATADSTEQGEKCLFYWWNWQQTARINHKPRGCFQKTKTSTCVELLAANTAITPVTLTLPLITVDVAEHGCSIGCKMYTLKSGVNCAFTRSLLTFYGTLLLSQYWGQIIIVLLTFEMNQTLCPFISKLYSKWSLFISKRSKTKQPYINKCSERQCGSFSLKSSKK